jgi:hypothetical protein
VTKLSSTLTVLLLISTGAAQAAVTCMQVYVGDSSYCPPPDKKGDYRCYVTPVYETKCFGSYDPEPLPPPSTPVPYYVDPSYIYMQSVDDSNPGNLALRFSAAPEFDNFIAYVDGVPYASGAGSITTLDGVPASALSPRAGMSNTITVEACASQRGYCALAKATVSVYAQGPMSSTSLVSALYLPLEFVSYPHNVTAQYNERVYSVASTPGNTKFIFTGILADFLYNRYTTTSRTELAKWSIAPGMIFADSAAMSTVSGDSLVGGSDTVETMRRGLPWLVGSAGSFEGEITQINRQTPEGIQFAQQIYDAAGQVSVP